MIGMPLNPYTTGSDLVHLAGMLGLPAINISFKDQLPHKMGPGLYIVNMQNSTAGEGTHWVGVYVPRVGLGAAYFDSFGEPPPLEIWRGLRGRKWIYNNMQIQDINDGFCGQFVILWLYYIRRSNSRSLQIRMMKFQRLFSDETEDNDDVLRAIFGGRGGVLSYVY